LTSESCGFYLEPLRTRCQQEPNQPLELNGKECAADLARNSAIVYELERDIRSCRPHPASELAMRRRSPSGGAPPDISIRRGVANRMGCNQFGVSAGLS
jgi:hypothetical protein